MYAYITQYCQKTMLFTEEKGIPINIELVPMRSYGDKPAGFMRMVPGGMITVITVRMKRATSPHRSWCDNGIVRSLAW